MHSDCSSCKDWVKFHSLQGVFFHFGYEHARSKKSVCKVLQPLRWESKARRVH